MRVKKGKTDTKTEGENERKLNSVSDVSLGKLCIANFSYYFLRVKQNTKTGSKLKVHVRIVEFMN